jgi:hypothetical protein
MPPSFGDLLHNLKVHNRIRHRAGQETSREPSTSGSNKSAKSQHNTVATQPTRLPGHGTDHSTLKPSQLPMTESSQSLSNEGLVSSYHPVAIRATASATQPSDTALDQAGFQLLSPQYRCNVIVDYGGESFLAFEVQVLWMERSSYKQLEDRVDQWFRERGTPGLKHRYQKSGTCRLLRHDSNRAFDIQVLESEDHWSTFVPRLINSFVHQNPYVKFHLEIRWAYSDLSFDRSDGKLFAEVIRHAIHVKLRPNWQNKNFIPRKDLDAIFSESTIEELINSDDTLRHFSAQGKEALAREAFLHCSRLLAVCVYVKLPLACFADLVSKGTKDTYLPLTDQDCPNSKYGIDFTNLVVWQGAFIAHNFIHDRPRPKHKELEAGVVVPIIFNEKTDWLGEGSFGTVYKVRIDPDHHEFSAVSFPFRVELHRFQADDMVSG